MDRYSDDVLAKGWQQAGRRRPAVPTPIERDLVLEEPTSGFVGAVVGWENGLVVLEDRKGKRRSFPFGPNFWLDGTPIDLKPPARVATARDRAQEYNRTHTASGSRVGPVAPAKVALPSRIYVEGRHDAELVEKVWGADLRHVGVVVEYLGGIDDLPAIMRDFAPAPGRRLGVLVDHLLPGTKEARIVAQVTGESVLVTGHDYIDIWAAIRPERLGLTAWPAIPKGQDWKKGICAALGWPHATQTDTANAWRTILGKVGSWRDLDPGLLTSVERLIDFVTQDHLSDDAR